MARLPDRFDLWVRKARQCPDPARQADYVLGALAALREWNFLALGPKENPQPVEAEMEGARHLLVFSDAGRIQEILEEGAPTNLPPAVITIPTAAAMAWCLQRRATGCAGLLVNPGEDAFAVSMENLETFHAEWTRRRASHPTGYWIPNLTTPEEDFWQEHGI